MIPFISRLLHLPVTRKEVLKRAKKLKRAGLCFSIDEALRDYGIDLSYAFVVKYFPKFRREMAFKFGGRKNSLWWWLPYHWDTGRMDFLNWLIKDYEDDKTNLRKMK